MGGRVVKRAYKYRFCPFDQQERELLRTFGCVRLVYDKALEARTAAWYGQQRRVNYVPTSALLTAWKKTEDLALLNEVSSVPLLSTRLVRENQTIVIEDLNVRGMIGNHALARAISDAACGALRAVLPLSVREWTCRCGVLHDRDVNAAHAILAAGRPVAACADGVRPQRESSRTGQSSVKQETQRASWNPLPLGVL